MGGKHKQAQRVKNNARPSSSGRSAELLGTSINPFIGFSTVKDASLPALSGLPFTPTSIEEPDLNIDTNFQLVLKKMNKKDSTTKLKALQEFTELVQSSQPEAVKAILSFWVRLYGVLAVDTEHKLREATHVAHRAVVLKVKRDLAPHLKQLIGPWFTSQYDTYAPAASAASQSFQDAFPPNKIQGAIIFCQDEILSYICDNITVQTPQTLSNPKTTSAEDAEAKYERVLIASLQGYTLYLNKLNSSQLQEATEVNNSIISNSKFWKLSKSKVPPIRGAWFGCIVALFQNAPFLLQNDMSHVISAVFCNLDESEPSVLTATWDAALFIISNVDDWWKHVSVEKLVLPKLWKVLKEAGQGSAVVIYPNLLPLISHLPADLDMVNFYGNFFENIKTGMKKKSIIQSRIELGSIVTSFVECFRYIVMKNVSDIELCEKLITNHLIPIISWSFMEETIVTKILYAEISVLLQCWGKNQRVPEYVNYNKLLTYFWLQITDTLKTNLLISQTQSCDKEKYLSIVNKHIEFLLCLKRINISKQKKQKVSFISTPDEIQHLSEQSINNVSSTSELINPINNELNDLVQNLCLFYLNFINENRRNELITPVCFLLQNFDSEKLFTYLLTTRQETGFQFLKNIFLKFLQIESTCLECVVDIIFILFKYLSNTEKHEILQNIVNLKIEKAFCWCVAKALSHPYCNDKVIQCWLRMPSINTLLINIASEMLEDEILPEKSLLLRRALSQNDEGELYVSKEACEKIILLFDTCLRSPEDFPCTIDVCSSFAAELASTLYTEQTLLSYGDNLILGLFSLSCNTNYDADILSKDTLWEVSTAWQDILLLLNSANLKTEFNDIIVKFIEILQSEFIKTDETSIVIEQLTTVAVDLIKCIIQTDTEFQLLYKILSLPINYEPVKNYINEICIYGRIVTGQLTYRDECPINNDVLNWEWNYKDIMKLFHWYQFVINVTSLLFKKPQQNNDADEENDDDDDDDDNDEDDDDNNEGILLKTTTIEINNYIIDCLRVYSCIKYFIITCKTTKLYNSLLEIHAKYKNILMDFFTKILSNNNLNEFKEQIEMTCFELSYILYKDFLQTENLLNVYNRIVKYNFDKFQLIQTFANYLTYDRIRSTEDQLNSFVVARLFINSEDIDVQLSECLSSVIKMRENKYKPLLFDRDISLCDWKDVQIVIELIRLLSEILQNKPLFLSDAQWDFILIALTDWCNSVVKSKHVYQQLQVQQFIVAVYDLYNSFHSFIHNDDLVKQLRQSCASIPTTYSDVFAEDVNIALIQTWIHIAEKENETNKLNPVLLPALEKIGLIICHLDKKYLTSTVNSKLPKWQHFVQINAKLFTSPVSVLQLWGYHGIKLIIPSLISIDEKTLTESDSEQRLCGLLSSHIGHVLTTTQEVVLMMLLEFKLGEETCRVEPFTDSYRFTLGYLLIWDLFLSYCQQASNNLRYQYSDWLKSGDYLKNLLNNIFRLMPMEVLHCAERKNTNAIDLFRNEPSFHFSDPQTSEFLEHVVCWVYARTLTNLPALVRAWWQNSDPRIAHTAEQVTAAHVSQVLIAHELKDVMDRRQSVGDNMRVSIHSPSREVIATYMVDELRMELVITLPVNHPLGSVHVECKQQIGGTAQWHNWVMQLTVFLTHQNGRIWDGLLLWKNNLDKKFSGVEECYICFSVLHNTTFQLPKLSCQTCKKKFHSSCLYKWFSTSNKSTCPICRNLF